MNWGLMEIGPMYCILWPMSSILYQPMSILCIPYVLVQKVTRCIRKTPGTISVIDKNASNLMEYNLLFIDLGEIMFGPTVYNDARFSHTLTLK
jgi:hypothetical protein